MNKPVCVWFSRHAPLPEQREALAAYDIVQVADRCDDAVDAWAVIQKASHRACGCRPALIVAVLPSRWESWFVKLVNGVTDGKTVIVHMDMTLDRVWSGSMRRMLWSEPAQAVTYFGWQPPTPINA